MEWIYMVTAAVGCTALVAQIALQLLGLGSDAETHTDIEVDDGGGNFFFGVLSFKTLSAFAAFFGLAGLAARQAGIENEALQLVMALLAGAAAGAIVMVMMRGLAKLQASGTADLDAVVGKSARVYLRIPGHGKGDGKIIVELQGREMELSAQTLGAEIPTGASVEVTRRLPGDSFEVVRL